MSQTTAHEIEQRAIADLAEIMRQQRTRHHPVPVLLDLYQLPAGDALHAENVRSQTFHMNDLTGIEELPDNWADLPAPNDLRLATLLDDAIATSEPLGFRIAPDIAQTPSAWDALLDSEPLCATHTMLCLLRDTTQPYAQRVACPTHLQAQWQVHATGSHALAINSAPSLGDMPYGIAIAAADLAWLKSLIAQASKLPAVTRFARTDSLPA